MLYIPTTIRQEELDILANVYFGGEWAVYYANKPAIVIGSIEMTGVGLGAYTDNGATAINNGGTKATGTLTFTAAPTASDTVTIDGQVYTWKTALTPAANEVLIGGSAAAAIANLKAAINHEDGIGTTYGAGTVMHATVECSATTATTLVVRALTAGTAGNSLATTEAGTNTSWGAATLAGGLAYASDLQLVCTNPILAPRNKAMSITLDGLDDTASPVAMKGTGTFTPPAWVADAGFEFQRGFAVDLVPATSGKKFTSITGLHNITGGAKGLTFDLYQLPVETDYVLIGCTTDKVFNTKSRGSKGVDCGMIADAFIKRGKTSPGDLSIGGKFKSFGDGLSRIDGKKVTVRLDGLKDGQVLGDRVVFTQYVPMAKPSFPDGDGEATVKSEGKYGEMLMFMAGYTP